MIRHFLTAQFLRFLAVGGLAALLHWLARVLLSVWMPFSLAVIAAYAVGMAVAFVLNSAFVFPNSRRARHLQIRDFVLVNLAFSPVVWIASLQINHWLKSVGVIGYSEGLAHALAISLPMIATFLIYKFVAFKEQYK